MKKSVKQMLVLILLWSIIVPGVRADVVFAESGRGNSETSIEPYADSIVIKYRDYRGRLQYRRWNETRRYWVDSSWIDVK